MRAAALTTGVDRGYARNCHMAPLLAFHAADGFSPVLHCIDSLLADDNAVGDGLVGLVGVLEGRQ